MGSTLPSSRDSDVEHSGLDDLQSSAWSRPHLSQELVCMQWSYVVLRIGLPSKPGIHQLTFGGQAFSSITGEVCAVQMSTRSVSSVKLHFSLLGPLMFIVVLIYLLWFQPFYTIVVVLIHSTMLWWSLKWEWCQYLKEKQRRWWRLLNSQKFSIQHIWPWTHYKIIVSN